MLLRPFEAKDRRAGFRYDGLRRGLRSCARFAGWAAQSRRFPRLRRGLPYITRFARLHQIRTIALGAGPSTWCKRRPAARTSRCT